MSSVTEDFHPILERGSLVSTGINPLDLILQGGLLRGTLAVIHSPTSTRSLTPLLVRLVIHRGRTNPKNPIWVIDGINSFPFFQIGESARAAGLDEGKLLESILVARAFNYHQLTELVREKLPEAFDPSLDPLIVVCGISDLYVSPEARQYLEYDKKEPTHSLLEFNTAIRSLTTLAMRHNLAVLATTHTAHGSRFRPAGGRYLQHTAGIVVQVVQTAIEERWLLQHHPSLPEKELTLPFDPGTGRLRSPSETMEYHLGLARQRVLENSRDNEERKGSKRPQKPHNRKISDYFGASG